MIGKKWSFYSLAAIALVAILAGALGFRLGTQWGGDRARAELLARDIGVRLSSVAYSRLTDGCSVSIYLGYFLKDPPSARTALNLQGALERSPAMLELEPFSLQQGKVSAYLRSPWLMHKYEGLADDVDEYRGVLVSYEEAIQAIKGAGPDYMSISAAERQELTQALTALRGTLKVLARLYGDEPSKWSCGPIN
jgi:hypothetical protein